MGTKIASVAHENGKKRSFHSINIPSEWGLHITQNQPLQACVSIQLISPASGDDSINGELKAISDDL